MTKEDILQRAEALRCAGLAPVGGRLVDDKIDILRHYDVFAMDRVLAVCCWGRSGSYLLSSYLDDHDQIVMLPFNHSQWVYDFLDEYSALSLHDKLLAYPVYVDDLTESTNWWTKEPFFGGDNPVAAADYYAAVEAIFSLYGDQPTELLELSRTFFQFLHIVYAAALGRRSVHPHPVIVFALHQVRDAVAMRLLEDFPAARFVHTIRDPISNFASSFAAMHRWQIGDHSTLNPRYFFPALETFIDLPGQDRPNQKMETRTVAVRFEDMHVRPADTIGRLARWLDLRHQDSLLESTFNGAPYVNYSQGKSWVGARAEQARRRSPSMWLADRAMVFALLHEDFVTWNYSVPRWFSHTWVRWLTWVVLLPVPLGMELVTARTVVRLQVLPYLARGRFVLAFRALARLIACHVSVRRLVRAELSRRLAGRNVPLRLLD